mmetsp:Transcript_33262/g.61833  ORF Transcript_33262/g.61833 Transcript_33262/m.61833 type:complete len:203 (-) Transcript_33262:60-668(-)
MTIGGVLGSVAGALELVLSGVPRNNASKVGADGVKSVAVESVLLVDDEVGRVTLDTLNKVTGVLLVGLEPLGGGDRVTELVKGTHGSSSASGLRRVEVVGVWAKSGENGRGDGGKDKVVHKLPLAHVRDHIRVLEEGLGGRLSDLSGTVLPKVAVNLVLEWRHGGPGASRLQASLEILSLAGEGHRVQENPDKEGVDSHGKQ